MSSLNAKDRVSLCLFSFTDGRRCRTPRIASHPQFCFYHAQKEAQAQAAASLGKDLAYFFSGNYLSACDLSAAFSRLIPAVVRGEVKPRLARTVAYMMQPSCRPSTSLSTNTSMPSAPTAGAKPSAIPLKATMTISSRQLPNSKNPTLIRLCQLRHLKPQHQIPLPAQPHIRHNLRHRRMLQLL